MIFARKIFFPRSLGGKCPHAPRLLRLWVQISLLHQSTRSSVHLLLGLPLLFLPPIMPNTACFRSLLSCILQYVTEEVQFPLDNSLHNTDAFARSFHDMLICVFWIFCCHFMFNNQLTNSNSINAQRRYYGISDC